MTESKKTVYVIQELPGTKIGAPKINIMSASKYGEFKFLLPEFSQIIGVACSIVSEITNGKYNLLKWDKQDRMYYSIEINLHEKGKVNDE
jgi:hypothetical protein